MKRGRFENIPSFSQFLHHKRVIQLFRDMIKSTKQLDNKELAVDIRNQIRIEFKNNLTIQDKKVISGLLSEGSKKLKMINNLSPSNNWEEKRTSTWLSDSKDPSDERGRVGVGWPWERN
jgi:hypothetical protein